MRIHAAFPAPRVSHRSCNTSHSCPSRSAAQTPSVGISSGPQIGTARIHATACLPSNKQWGYPWLSTSSVVRNKTISHMVLGCPWLIFSKHLIFWWQKSFTELRGSLARAAERLPSDSVRKRVGFGSLG